MDPEIHEWALQRPERGPHPPQWVDAKKWVKFGAYCFVFIHVGPFIS